MSDTDLLAETNRLLQKFFDMRQKDIEEAEKARAEHEAWSASEIREALLEHHISQTDLITRIAKRVNLV